MPQNNNASLHHNTYTRHASGIRSPAPSHTPEPHEAASSSKSGCQSRRIGPHSRKAATPAAKGTPWTTQCTPKPVRSHAHRRSGIYAANNYNPYTSLITFDMISYVDQSRLLAVLRTKGIPRSICRWVQLFVNSRETSIRGAGHTDRAKAMQTGCPQGSPVSRILVNHYTTMLLEMLMQ